MGSGGECSTSGRSYYSVLGVHLLVRLTETHPHVYAACQKHYIAVKGPPAAVPFGHLVCHALIWCVCVCQATDVEIKAAYKGLARVKLDAAPRVPATQNVLPARSRTTP